MEYLVAQDEECKLLTVGAWAAMTGYGAAFPRNSKHFMNFDRKVMDFSENGKNSLDIDLQLNILRYRVVRQWRIMRKLFRQLPYFFKISFHFAKFK